MNTSGTIQQFFCKSKIGSKKRFKMFTDQPWDFFGRNDAKAETPVLWPPYAKS